MTAHERYPVLEIRSRAIQGNATTIVDLCKSRGIAVAGVIKGVNGLEPVAELMDQAGCVQIASSRVEQLVAYKKKHPETETLLLRLPMASEIHELSRGIDMSLNSERQTLELIELHFKKIKKTHQVILMMDLGDLREGYFDENELIETALWIEKSLNSVILAGIGTNLGCYGAIKPTVDNLSRLVSIAHKIEYKIKRKLKWISGGATSSLPMVLDGSIPSGVNHLRIGEGILLNMDLPLIWNVTIPGLSQETLLLKAQIIEIKRKPSMPVGEIFVDAFGHTPHYEDRGVRLRALVALGKQDFAMEDKLYPQDEGIQIVGSSSDHLILDLTDSSETYHVGDAVVFRLFYGPALHLCTHKAVKKRMVSW